MRKNPLVVAFLVAPLLLSSIPSQADLPQGKAGLEKISRHIAVYRQSHEGAYPKDMSILLADMNANWKGYGFADKEAVRFDLLNKDDAVQHFRYKQWADTIIPYMVTSKRIDGAAVGSPHPKDQRDILAYTDLYVRNTTGDYDGTTSSSP
ncbi:hypothetical protein EON80_12425, partial [bacterium]